MRLNFLVCIPIKSVSIKIMKINGLKSKFATPFELDSHLLLPLFSLMLLHFELFPIVSLNKLIRGYSCLVKVAFEHIV